MTKPKEPKDIPQEPTRAGSRTREINNELVGGHDNGFGDKVVNDAPSKPQPEANKLKGEPRVRQGAEPGAEKDLKKSEAGMYDNYGLKQDMEDGSSSGANNARPIRKD